MRAFVFTDKALARYAGQFVWLAIDTENRTNAAFLKKFPISVWPTLLIVDPKNEEVALRYPGGASVPQLEKLLADGARVVRGTKSQADELIARADQLASEGKHAEAAEVYAEAIAAAPKNWSRIGRASESLTFTLLQSRQEEKCAAEALRLYPRVRGTYSAANVANTGLSCATDLPEHGAAFEALEKAAREALDDPKIPLAADDRSGLYEALVGAHQAIKDEAGAHKLAEEWAAFLEKQAKEAKTPEQRASFDPHRLEVYIDLKEPQRAVPMLEQSERDFPNDYNPPARLGIAYREMGKYEESLAAFDRALPKAYGPRKIVVYRGKADTYAAKGDKEAARRTIEEAIKYAESLPTEQGGPRLAAALKKRLEAI